MNLLLTGVAVSNVFDGNVELDSGGTTTVRRLCLVSEVNIVAVSYIACGGCLCQKCSNYGRRVNGLVI